MNMNTTELVGELQSAWGLLFPEVPSPDSRQWAIWITLHGQSVVREAIGKLAVRYQRSNDLQTPESLYKFASALMGKLSRERTARVEVRK